MRAGILFLLLLLHSSAFAAQVALQLAGHRLRAEIADTPALREQGLMGRTALCGECGMLFIFPSAAPHAFWMKNTPLPLDIAFIDPDGVITDIQSMQPYSLEVHAPGKRVLYALEMPQGWFAARKIRPGMRIETLARFHALH
ncbi:MAG: DUF192 domain-containing protein [Pseudomonadota bacterium]